jgi:hypothetical protein
VELGRAGEFEQRCGEQGSQVVVGEARKSDLR